MPKYLSVSSIVTAPASTGIAAISRNAVMIQVHTNIGSLKKVMPGARMLNTVVITLIAPITDETPIRWIAKIRNGNAMPV